MTRRLLLAAALAAGCGRTAPPEPVAVVGTETPQPPPPEPAPTPDTPAVPGQPLVLPGPKLRWDQPAPTAVKAELPDDMGGQAVAKAVAGTLPPTPVLPATTVPKARSSPVDRADLPTAFAVVTPPRAVLPPAKRPNLSPPPEPLPSGLGRPLTDAVAGLTAALPARPPLPPSNPAPPLTAADLPRLGYPTGSRAPLEDPTAEISSARVIQTAVPAPDPVAWFARVGIPDPFEFAQHVRGKLPLDGELGATPANVPAAKP